LFILEVNLIFHRVFTNHKNYSSKVQTIGK
jgi:hypothetical protein